MSSAPTSVPLPAASSEAFAQPSSLNHGVSDHVRPAGLFHPLQFEGEAEHDVGGTTEERDNRRGQQRRGKPGQKLRGRSLNPFAKEFVPGGESSLSGCPPGSEVGSPGNSSGGRKKDASNWNASGRRGGHHGQRRQSVILREDVRSSPEYSLSPSSAGDLSESSKRGNSGHGNHRASRAYGGQSPSMRIPSGQSSTSHALASLSGGRKGQGFNANHLLNFQYDPIPRPAPRAQPVSRRPRKPQPFDKELFLQANFRFLVSDFGDYMQNTSDPDKMLQWEDVAAVDFSASQPVQCPICLDPPLCPQITSCGHIYCFPCLLRYLMMGVQDVHVEPWKKCPLCFAMISYKELRTVLIHDVRQYCVGDMVRFTLLTRAKESIIPFEVTETASGPLAYSEDGQCHLFSKFTLTSNTELTTSKAVNELMAWAEKAQLQGGEETETLPFVFVAIDQLRQRKSAWMERRATEFLSQSPPVRQRIMAQVKPGNVRSSGNISARALHKSKAVEGDDGTDELGSSSKSPSQGKVGSADVDVVADVNSAMAQLKERAGWVYESAFSDDENDLPTDQNMSRQSLENASPEQSKSPVDSADERPDPGKDCVGEPTKDDILIPEYAEKHDQHFKKEQVERGSYTFYQSADGQTFMLHPLNLKCLLHHYGSYEALPTSLEAKVVEMEAVTQMEFTRKRYRYLSHLPLTAIFQFCEVDLGPVLPDSAFAPYADELRARETRRHRIMQQDKEQREMEEKTSAAEIPKSTAPTDADFAATLVDLQIDETISNSDFEDPVGNSTGDPGSPPEPSERKLFANVAKLGFASGHDAPDLMTQRQQVDLPSGSSPTSSAWTSEAGPSRGPVSFADIIVAQAKDNENESALSNKPRTKKGKRGSKVIMSTAGGWRY